MKALRSCVRRDNHISSELWTTRQRPYYRELALPEGDLSRGSQQTKRREQGTIGMDDSNQRGVEKRERNNDKTTSEISGTPGRNDHNRGGISMETELVTR